MVPKSTRAVARGSSMSCFIDSMDSIQFELQSRLCLRDSEEDEEKIMPTACTACRKRTRCRSKLRNFRSDLSHIFSFCILLLVHHGSSTTSARRCLFLEGLFGTMTLSPGEDKDWSPSPDRWSPGPAHCNYSAEFGCCQSSFDSSWTDLNKTATLTNHIGRR